MEIIPTEAACGAELRGLDLRRLSESQVADVRAALLAHEVVFARDQRMGPTELARFTEAFGKFGDEPYVDTLSGHPHVVEVRREPSERASPFGAGWHSDWSFQPEPPSATILLADTVPPIGGDTLYASGSAAFEALAPEMQERLFDLTVQHSARRPYSPEGFLATRGPERSMAIRASAEAYQEQEHPLLLRHPESGRTVLWVNAVYALRINGLSAARSDSLLQQLLAHAVDLRFVYRHHWQPGTLTIWDNRSVAHQAQGGYDGYRRVMYRTTVKGERPIAARR